MSHEIVKTIRFDEKKNSIKICSADSSLRPLRYRTFEFVQPGENYQEKRKSCFIHFMNGNLQFNKSRQPDGFRTIIGYCFMYKNNTVGDVFGFDLENKSNFNEDADNILYEEMMLPYFLGKEPYYLKTHKRLSDLGVKMLEYLERYEAQLKSEGKLRVYGASFSNIYEGYDVFIGPDDDETIIAPRENYHNDGLLDNSNGDAIYLGKGTRVLWSFLRFDGYGDKTKQDILNNAAKYDQTHPGANYLRYIQDGLELLDKVVQEKLSHLTMTKLPYQDFNMAVNT